MCDTVDFPRVPVTRTILAPASIACLAKRAVDIATGIPAVRAISISGESNGTPAALITMSQSVKSFLSCPPSLNETCVYCFNFSTDSASSDSLLLSVTKTSAPHFARNSTSPTPRPKSPKPSTVMRLSLKSSGYPIKSLYRLRTKSHPFSFYRLLEKDTAEDVKSLCVACAIKPYHTIFPDVFFQCGMPLQVRREAFGDDIVLGNDFYVRSDSCPDFCFQNPIMRTTEHECINTLFEQRSCVVTNKRIDTLVLGCTHYG